MIRIGLLVAVACVVGAAEPTGGAGSASVSAIRFDDLRRDNRYVAPLRPTLDHLIGERGERFAAWRSRWTAWTAGMSASAAPERIRAAVQLAALADLGRHEFEGEIAHVVFVELRARERPDDLRQALTAMILHPGDGPVRRTAPELGIAAVVEEAQLRERSALYARKLLGRVLGVLTHPPAADPPAATTAAGAPRSP